MSSGPINGVDPDKVQRPRYDIDMLADHSTPDKARRATVERAVTANGFRGRFHTGETCGINWIATQDPDGQIEISFSTLTKRPLDFQLIRIFKLFKMQPLQEESKKMGKVRHFVMQKGYQQ